MHLSHPVAGVQVAGGPQVRAMRQFQDAVAAFEQGQKGSLSGLRALSSQLPKGAAHAVTGTRATFYFSPSGVVRVPFTGTGAERLLEWKGGA